MPVSSQPPAPTAPLLERYLEIERVARRMLDAGRAGEWTQVADLESAIRALADRLSQAAEGSALSPAEQRERLRIVRRLVLIDGDLRRLAQPANRWLDTMFACRRRPGDAQRGAA